MKKVARMGGGKPKSIYLVYKMVKFCNTEVNKVYWRINLIIMKNSSLEAISVVQLKV